MAEGVRDALIVWNGILIDGHNRYEIASKHNLPYKTVSKEFANRDEVIRWIILNQFGRRNLNNYQRSVLALKLKDSLAAEAEKRMLAGKADPIPTLGQGTTESKLAKIASVSHGTIAKVDTIQQKASDSTKQALAAGDISINQAYKEIKKAEAKQEREERKQEQISSAGHAIDIFNTQTKYRVIYADPPWSYNDKQNISSLGGAEKHYPTMPLQEICDLPVNTLTEENAVLFLWVTSPLLENCFEVINAWGFKYKTSFIWDKVAHNMGHYNSVRHEFLLIATKGSCTPDNKKLFDSVQSIEREEHSRKPEAFRSIIDTLYTYGNKLELFARRSADNWDVWGNMV